MNYSKTSPTELPDVFERTRLYTLLDKFCSRRVVWVQGPAGAGKTTLVAGYLKKRSLSALWYRIDSHDADPATFFHYFSHAIVAHLPTGHRPLPRITTEVLVTPIPFATLYFRELFRSLPKPMTLVFDNFHVLPPTSTLAEALLTISSEIPENICVIFVSRTSPPPLLSRLRLNRRLGILEQNDLRLTDEEVNGLIRLLLPQGYQPEGVQTMNSLVDGWIAGLVLLLERGDFDTSTGNVGSEYFFDYFASQIFDALDNDLKSFLLETACLNTMPLTVVKALTEKENAREILDDLCARHYFTSRSEQASPVYQYHPLFHEFLRNRAKADLGHQNCRGLAARGAAILAERGQFEEAVEMAINAADWHNAGALIHRLAPAMLSQQRIQTLEQWLHQLPPELFESLPWLYYWHGCCRRPMHQQESIRYFFLAYHSFGKQNQYSGMLLSASGAILSILTEWDDFRPLDSWMDALEELLIHTQTFPSINEEALVILSMFGALLFRKPHRTTISHWETQAQQLLLRSDLDISLRIDLGNVLSHYQFWQGDLAAASHTVDILTQLVETEGAAPLPQIFSAMNRAILDWHRADFDRCLVTIDQGLAASAEMGVHIMDDRLLAQSVYASLARDDATTAERFLNRMKPTLRYGRRLSTSHYHFLKGNYHFVAGDLEMARHHTRIAMATNKEVGAPYPEALAGVTLAQIYFEMGEESTAFELLAQAGNFARAMGSRTLELLTELSTAWFSLRGDESAALTHLRNGLSLQRRMGFINFPGWCNRIMKPLLFMALQHEIEPEFVRLLILRHNLHTNTPAHADDKWPWPVKIYTLGRFCLLIGDKPLQFATKAQQKPLELLKVIISFGGREIGKNKLIDHLWPDTDGDKAMRALDTTLHRLRKLVGLDQIIIVQDRKLLLNPQLCWLDSWALDKTFGQMDTLAGQTELTCDEAISLLQQVLALYQGDFLHNDDGPDCIISYRDRLRSKLTQKLGYLAATLEHSLAWQEAALLYEHIIEIDNCQEYMYQRLITCYQHLNRIGDALSIYERCRKVLKTCHGVAPSAATQALYHEMR